MRDAHVAVEGGGEVALAGNGGEWTMASEQRAHGRPNGVALTTVTGKTVIVQGPDL